MNYDQILTWTPDVVGMWMADIYWSWAVSTDIHRERHSGLYASRHGWPWSEGQLNCLLAFVSFVLVFYITLLYWCLILRTSL